MDGARALSLLWMTDTGLCTGSAEVSNAEHSLTCQVYLRLSDLILVSDMSWGKGMGGTQVPLLLVLHHTKVHYTVAPVHLDHLSVPHRPLEPYMPCTFCDAGTIPFRTESMTCCSTFDIILVLACCS